MPLIPALSVETHAPTPRGHHALDAKQVRLPPALVGRCPSGDGVPWRGLDIRTRWHLASGRCVH